MNDLYPLAEEFLYRPSTIPHPIRTRTLGIVMHWTAGREAGDLPTLDGPSVDCQFWVGKSGKVVQFLDPDSKAWHAQSFANNNCVGVEHEGRGEPYTEIQLAESAELVAWLCDRYDVPIRKVDPSGYNVETFRGIFGHRDLSIGGQRVDQNDHTDTVPDGTGWTAYLEAVRRFAAGPEAIHKEWFVEEMPFPSGGFGPRVSKAYGMSKDRDRALDAMHDAGDILTIPVNGRDGKFYIYTYKPGTYNVVRLRRGPWYSEAAAKNGRTRLEAKLGRRLRPFVGIDNSYYPL